MSKMDLLKLILIILLSGWQTPFPFLPPDEISFIGYGVRGMGMGDASVAHCDDISAIIWNPAALALLPGLQVALEHIPMFGGLGQMNGGGIGINLRKSMSLGIAYLRHQVNDIKKFGVLSGNRIDRDLNPQLRSNGKPLGYFDVYQQQFYLTLARGWRWILPRETWYSLPIPFELMTGINFKFFHHRIYGLDGIGLNSDLGLLAQVELNPEDSSLIPGRSFKIGVNIQDFAPTSVKFNTFNGHRDTFAVNFKFGVSYTESFALWKSAITLAVDRNLIYHPVNHLGLEYNFNNLLFFRGGYKTEGSFSFGLGVRYELKDTRFAEINYAFVSHEINNTPYKIGLIINF